MKRAIVILIIIIATLFLSVGYYIYRGEVHYYWYAQKVKHNPGFSEHAAALHQSFLNLYRDTSNPRAYIELGTIQYELKDYSSAAKSFLAAIKLNQNNSYAYGLLIHAYELDKKYDKAAFYAKQFIEKFSKDPASYSALAELYQFYDISQQSELPKIYDAALANTHDPQFLILEAQYYASVQDYSKAIEYLQQWLIDPTDNQSRQLIENLLKEYQSHIK